MYTDGTTTAKPYDWREDSECSRKVDLVPVYDPELWWPVGSNPAALKQTRDAQDVCHDLCPVRLACLRFALDEGITDGIFGGHTEIQRVEMAKQRKAQRRRERRQAEIGANA